MEMPPRGLGTVMGGDSSPRGTTFYATPREDTSDLYNDPRFFTGNVIDKRMAAFDALTIISGFMAGTAVGFLVNLQKDIRPNFMGLVQFVGFLMMYCVFVMDAVATIVFALQKWFTYRLMTAGPTGFDAAAEFYKSLSLTRWRHIAVFCLKWNLPFFMLAIGFMLTVKFIKDSDDTKSIPSFAGESPTLIESHLHKFLACFVLTLSVVAFVFLSYIVGQHSERHDACYAMTRPSLDEMRRRDPTKSLVVL